jgi:hypothetical protein
MLTTKHSGCRTLLKIYLFKSDRLLDYSNLNAGSAVRCCALLASVLHSYALFIPLFGLFNCIQSIYILHHLRFLDYNFCNYILYYFAILRSCDLHFDSICSRSL